ncbi:hypothetical protein KKB43_04325 [Patescibacteria group bacterium]|nr:hypothetical protein [Patescibacteria group bacterium]
MNITFKVIIGIAILFGLVLLGTFISNKYSGNNQKPGANPSDAQLPISASEKDEKELKELAENFVRAYGTYQFGDFTNLESLKSQMSNRLWSEKENFIEEKKQELENKPKKYITFSTFVKKSAILSQNNSLIEMEVSYTKREMRGAAIQGAATIEYVDEDGQAGKTSTSFNKEERAVLKFIKEDNEWKVDDILIK